MLEIKQQVTDRLTALGKVQYPKPTVMDLRCSQPLMGRVQRQENRLYQQRNLNQQKDFKLKLAKIEKYYADLRAEELRRLDLLSTYENIVAPDYPSPVFKPISLVVPKPLISVPGIPIRRIMRTQQRRRRTR